MQLPVVSTAECEFNYRLYFPNQVFDNRVLCAGYPQGGKDSCQVRSITLFCFVISFSFKFLFAFRVIPAEGWFFRFSHRMVQASFTSSLELFLTVRTLICIKEFIVINCLPFKVSSVLDRTFQVFTRASQIGTLSIGFRKK